jgi:phosphotransferase system IIA component
LQIFQEIQEILVEFGLDLVFLGLFGESWQNDALEEEGDELTVGEVAVLFDVEFGSFVLFVGVDIF